VVTEFDMDCYLLSLLPSPVCGNRGEVTLISAVPGSGCPDPPRAGAVMPARRPHLGSYFSTQLFDL
jgi:hypothetical protein